VNNSTARTSQFELLFPLLLFKLLGPVCCRFRFAFDCNSVATFNRGGLVGLNEPPPFPPPPAMSVPATTFIFGFIFFEESACFGKRGRYIGSIHPLLHKERFPDGAIDAGRQGAIKGTNLDITSHWKGRISQYLRTCHKGHHARYDKQDPH
jgi:hypothetical protein